MPSLRDASHASRPSLHRAATLAVGLMALCGCSASTPKPVVPRQPGEVVRARSGGAEIVTAVRPTPGLVRVSMWIDAGSRDGTPPQVATLAAWLAADSGKGELQALVYPDATELSRQCTPAELAVCVAQLAAALQTRAPTDTLCANARNRLRDGRRRATAHDPIRSAHAAALAALLPQGADGLLPLGDATRDADATEAAIGDFLSAHYGPERTFWVAAGDADPEAMRTAVQQALARAPKASRVRTEPRLAAHPEPRATALVDEQDAVVVALLGPSFGRVSGVVQPLQRALTRDPQIGLRSRAAVFATRGGVLGLIDVTGGTADALLATTTRELARAALEAPTLPLTASFPDDLAGVTQALASAWSTQGAAPVDRLSYAVAVMARGGRGDDTKTADPNAALRERTQARAEQALARALADADPAVRGAIQPHAASVVTANGARVEVRRVQGGDVAIAVRNLLGASQDPALLLGRSALLATLTSTACAGLSPSALDAELARLRATLSPRVDAHSYGLLLKLPSAAWPEGLDLALRCMQAPSRETPHVADALLRLQSRLGGARSALAMRAMVASLIAPRAPGTYAPWGDPARLGNLDVRDLTPLMTAANSGARSLVTVVGDVPVAEAVRHAATRLVALPAGALPAPIELGQPSLQTSAPATSGAATTFMCVWHTRGSVADPVTAMVTAAALQTLLSRTPGIEVLWRDGDAHGHDTWAALALRVAPEALPTLGSTLTSVGPRIDAALLADAVQRARDQAARADTAQASRVDALADTLASQRAAGTAPSVDLQTAIDAAGRLARTIPVFIAID